MLEPEPEPEFEPDPIEPLLEPLPEVEPEPIEPPELEVPLPVESVLVLFLFFLCLVVPDWPVLPDWPMLESELPDCPIVLPDCPDDELPD